MAMRFGFQAARAAHRDAEREFATGAPRPAQAAREHYLPAMPAPLRGIYIRHYAAHLAQLSLYGPWLGAWAQGA